MNFVIFLLLKLLLAGLGTCEENEVLRLPVINITEANYTEIVAKNELLFVMFYAPWCGACKGSFPHFVKAAEILKKKEPKVTLAAVDCTVETNIQEKFSITGFPTLKLFRKGVPLNYSGENREAEEMVSWVLNRTGPPVVTLKSQEEIKKFSNASNVAVVGYFNSTTTFAATEFKNFAQTIDSPPCGIVTSPDILKVTGQSVILYKNFDEKKVVLNSSLTSENIANFVGANEIPYVVDYGKDTTKLLRRPYKGILLILLSKEAGHYERVNLSALAKEHRPNEILFMRVNADEPERQRMLDLIGVKRGQLPAYRLVRFQPGTEEMSKYMPEAKVLKNPEEELKTFLEKFLAGNLTQFLLSADLPEDWDSSAVKVLVSSNFDEIVFDKANHVLVKFSTPSAPTVRSWPPFMKNWARISSRRKTLSLPSLMLLLTSCLIRRSMSIPSFDCIRRAITR